MASYQDLKDRIDNGEVIILDGAIGTELQGMGVPMHPVCWCAEALITQPSTVVQMHQRYINAGVDVITTNTYSTTRSMLEPSGYGTMVREFNTRAVHLARDAIARAGGSRPVYVAGSISSYVGVRNPRTGAIQGANYAASHVPAHELQDDYNRVAEYLAEAGIDFFLIEAMGWHNESRKMAVTAARATGLPVWAGFTSNVYNNDGVARMKYGGQSELQALTGTEDPGDDITLAEGVAEIVPMGCEVMSVFHSKSSDTIVGLEVMLESWPGPISVYPDAARRDYTQTWQDRSMSNERAIQEFVEEAKRWVGMGAQIIGACCGYGAEYIEPLRDALPTHIASPRKAA